MLCVCLGVCMHVCVCVCVCVYDDGLMVLCAVCNTWQHALCFALLTEEDVPETHICASCSQKQVNLFYTLRSLSLKFINVSSITRL